MAKREMISDVVIVLKSRRNKVAVASWNTEEQKAYNHGIRTTDANLSGTPAILATAAEIIDNFIKQNNSGQIGLVIPDDAALKAFQIQKHLNRQGLTAAKQSYRTEKQKWMSKDWLACMDMLTEALDIARNSEIVIAITKESDLDRWELLGELDNVKEGDTVTLTVTQDPDTGFWTSETEDKSIYCRNQFISGTFTVHTQNIINQSTHELSRITYWIDREFNELSDIDNHAFNVRQVRDFLITQLPTIKRISKLEFAA